MTATQSLAQFSHLDEGTPEARWTTCGQWAGCADAAELLADVSRLIVLSAHPDDETLAVGGFAAHAHRQSVGVHFVLATDGEASHPHSPTHTPRQLAAVRVAEYDAALEILAPGATRSRLGLPDGDLAAHEPAVSLALTDLLSADTAAGTGDVLIAAPWRGDRHPDHAAAGAAAVAAARALERREQPGRRVRVVEYPIWLWHWGEPVDVPWDRTVVFQLSKERRHQKAAAMDAHRSQVEPLSNRAGDEALLSAQVLAHFNRPFEVLFTTGP